MGEECVIREVIMEAATQRAVNGERGGDTKGGKKTGRGYTEGYASCMIRSNRRRICNESTYNGSRRVEGT
jgi:hypothetical protein